MVPIPNSDPEGIKQIQLSLIVDYHETYLLSLLNKMNRDKLTEDAKLNEEQSDKKQQLSPKSRNSDQLQREVDETKDKNPENLEPINFNKLSDIGKLPPKEQQEDKSQENRKQGQINARPYQLNLMSLDRFAYVSNCPTGYTDPTGHHSNCNIGSAVLSGLLLVGGGLVAGVGAVVFFTGLATFSIEGLGAMAIGGITTGSGVGFAIVGGYIIYKSDCIPGLSP